MTACSVCLLVIVFMKCHVYQRHHSSSSTSLFSLALVNYIVTSTVFQNTRSFFSSIFFNTLLSSKLPDSWKVHHLDTDGHIDLALCLLEE